MIRCIFKDCHNYYIKDDDNFGMCWEHHDIIQCAHTYCTNIIVKPRHNRRYCERHNGGQCNYPGDCPKRRHTAGLCQPHYYMLYPEKKIKKRINDDDKNNTKKRTREDDKGQINDNVKHKKIHLA